MMSLFVVVVVVVQPIYPRFMASGIIGGGRLKPSNTDCGSIERLDLFVGGKWI